MAEILSLLIDSINNADRIQVCVFVVLMLFLFSPIMIPMWFESDPPVIATVIMAITLISVCTLPAGYFSYTSSEYREKAAKLCDQIPECNFEEMYNKAKLYTKNN